MAITQFGTGTAAAGQGADNAAAIMGQQEGIGIAAAQIADVVVNGTNAQELKEIGPGPNGRSSFR